MSSFTCNKSELNISLRRIYFEKKHNIAFKKLKCVKTETIAESCILILERGCGKFLREIKGRRRWRTRTHKGTVATAGKRAPEVGTHTPHSASERKSIISSLISLEPTYEIQTMILKGCNKMQFKKRFHCTRRNQRVQKKDVF